MGCPGWPTGSRIVPFFERRHPVFDPLREEAAALEDMDSPATFNKPFPGCPTVIAEAIGIGSRDWILILACAEGDFGPNT